MVDVLDNAGLMVLVEKQLRDSGIDDSQAITDYLSVVDRLVLRATSRGDGVAVYENHDLGHPELGERQYMSYGGPDSQLETRDGAYDVSNLRNGHAEPFAHAGDLLPTTLPDMGGRINWRFVLVAVVPA